MDNGVTVVRVGGVVNTFRCCDISAIISVEVEFTAINELRKARMGYVYPRTPCG